MADDDAARKAQEREAKKAEVRKRLEEAGNKKKAKKGFLTPERKKKLRKLLMVKAAEDLKRQQLEKEQQRQKVLAERTIPLPNVDSIDDKGQLEKIYNDLFDRVCKLEEEKYDINYLVTAVEGDINQLTIEVNDLRGKFVKPSLKKVSKYDNKFKKMAESSAAKSGEKKQDFRASLKTTKKDVLSDINNIKKKEKPGWSTEKANKGAEDAAPAAPVEEAKPEEAAEEEAPVEEHEEVEEEEEEEEEE